jgi:carboxyl-terminal processing protease
MDRSMVPAEPDLAMPGSSPGPEDTRPIAGRPRRIPFLAISIALVALMAGSALFLSGYTMGRQASTEPGTPAAEGEAFRPFWDTYHAISDRYAGGEVDRTIIVQGAIRGMIGSLGDPYSAYLSSDEYRQSLLGISGQFEGIGAEIVARGTDGAEGCSPLGADCHLVVTKPIEGSPAEKAGVRIDDVVVSVDEASVEGLTVDAARDRIRGPKGSVVTLSVLRGHAPLIQLTITRDIVQSKEVERRALADGQIGYIRLSSFSDAAADEVVKALKTHLAAERTRLILDVRGNPGGYVTAARKIASQFVASGPVFWEQDAQGNQVATDSLGDGVATAADLRIVVLIDSGSASASEIVAGALQDTGRAQLIGQQSFGKGTVQQWQELSGQGGAFKLTIARWLTPDKRWVHQVGLTPDVVVRLPDPLPAGGDPTLDRAIEILTGPAALNAIRVAA